MILERLDRPIDSPITEEMSDPAVPSGPDPGLGALARGWSERQARLRTVEQRAAAEPRDVDALVAYAEALDELNLRDRARDAYAAALRVDPNHFGAIMRFGALLGAGGNAAEARTVFAEAVRRHGGSAAPHVALAGLLADENDPAAALVEYEAAIASEPGNRDAQRGAAIMLERLGRLEDAERRWRDAFPNGSVEVSRYRGYGTPYRVLFVTSALGGNIPMQHVIDERLIEPVTLIAESAPPDVDLPPHDVVFNAVGDADRCSRALTFVERIAARTNARVINDPLRVRATSRLANARRFAAIPDVIAPHAAAYARADLSADDAVQRLERDGFTWPVLLRSPGYHTGLHFVRVDEPSALADAVAALPGDTLLAMAFADTRAADGTYRKYRAMTIGGRLYPLHLAIGPSWKVHYFTAAMGENAAYREEEARYLAGMEATLGSRAVRALDAIAAAAAIDYGGIDFTLDAQGRVVVFEANPTMVILPPSTDPQWDYRRAPILAAIEAARRLLLNR